MKELYTSLMRFSPHREDCQEVVSLEQKDIEYFRTLLNNMLEEAQHKGDSTLEDLTDSNELLR